MTYIHLLALDPGGTTGWATFEGEYKRIGNLGQPESTWLPVFIGNPVWTCGQFGPEDHHTELYKFAYYELCEDEGSVLISESFEYRNNSPTGLELISKEYIGIAKLVAKSLRIPYVEQSASQGKVRDKNTAFVKPSNLKKLGFWQPSNPHAMDALGHLIYYLVNKNIYKKELLEKGWKK